MRCKKIYEKSSTRLDYEIKNYGKSVSSHPTVTSKMLLPTDEETAMSPNPFLATMTEVIRSGMEVPAARKVNPITCTLTVTYTCIKMS